MTRSAVPLLGDTLARALGAAAIAGLRADAGFFDAVISEGLLPASAAEADPGSSSDPAGLVRDLGVTLGAAAAERPSLLEEMGIDPLDLMRRDAVAPSVIAARARRIQATVAVVHASEELPVEVVWHRNGRLAKRLGPVHAAWFDDAADAVHCLLDLAEVAGASVLAGADHGEVLEAGGDVFGPTLSGAARLASVAEPGEMLVAPAFRDPLGAVLGVAFDFVAPRAVDGGDPAPAWSVRRS